MCGAREASAIANMARDEPGGGREREHPGGQDHERDEQLDECEGGAHVGTIGYEIVAAIGERVPRVNVGEPK